MNDAIQKRALSPLRYPGGKAALYPYLKLKISKLPEANRVYVEPYAGGAGAAIRLLASGVVENIVLNDADRRIYLLWHYMLHEPEWFIDQIKKVKVNIDFWSEARQIISNSHNYHDQEVAFATFFLNRTNRSGIIIDAGPIGGYQQNGQWKLDARFYKESLVSRIEWLSSKKQNISLHNIDGLQFLKEWDKAQKESNEFIFIDPPYVGAGSRLYLNGMTESDHEELAKYLCARDNKNWTLTYDKTDIIKKLYKNQVCKITPIRYSLQSKRTSEELVIEPT